MELPHEVHTKIFACLKPHTRAVMAAAIPYYKDHVVEELGGLTSVSLNTEKAISSRHHLIQDLRDKNVRAIQLTYDHHNPATKGRYKPPRNLPDNNESRDFMYKLLYGYRDKLECLDMCGGMVVADSTITHVIRHQIPVGINFNRLKVLKLLGLKRYNCNHCRWWLIPHCPNLVSYTLQCTPFDIENCRYPKENCKNLRELGFRDCGLLVYRSALVFKTDMDKIKSLDLSDNNSVMDSALMPISLMAALTRLSLVNCDGLTIQSIRILDEGSANLKSLHLYGVRIPTDQMCYEIGVSRLTLSHLTVGQSLSDVGLLHLINNGKTRYESLGSIHPKIFSDDGLKGFADSCPKLGKVMLYMDKECEPVNILDDLFDAMAIARRKEEGTDIISRY